MLKAREWYREAASVASTEMVFSDISADSLNRLKTIEAGCLVAYADACVAIGNAPLATDAIDRCVKATDASVESTQIDRLKAALTKLGAGGSPTPLSSPNPLRGKGTWLPVSSGYTCETIQLGHNQNHGEGAGYSADIKVAGGFALDGGILNVACGSITFEGSPDKPVILRNVEFDCEFTGSVSATNTVFINCSFKKTGGWFWNGGFNAKWQFRDCLLQNCKFPGFGKFDHGVKILRCAFVHCSIPSRLGGGGETATDDANQTYGGEWNQFVDSDLYECDIAPSAVWIMRGCNFSHCTVSGSDTFTSKTDMTAVVGSDVSSAGILDALQQNTTCPATGKISYKRSANLFARPRPVRLWRFAEELVTDDPQQGK